MRRLVASIYLAVVGVTGMALADEEPRTFRSADGQSLEATLMDFEDGNVKLLLASGRAALVPIERLSEADRAYVSDWAERFKSRLPLGALRMRFDKEEVFQRGGSPGKNDGGGQRIKRRTRTSYELTVENATDETIGDVELHYWVYKQVNRNAGRAEVEVAVQRREDLGELEAKGSQTVVTDEVLAVDWVAKSTRQSEKTFGVIADVVVDGVLYRRFGFPDNAIDYVSERLERQGGKMPSRDYSGRGGGRGGADEEPLHD